jgi:hypothetical protein
MVQKVWGKPQEAEKASEWVERTGIPLHNISPDDRLIWIKPGETILAHTVLSFNLSHRILCMCLSSSKRTDKHKHFLCLCVCVGVDWVSSE